MQVRETVGSKGPRRSNDPCNTGRASHLFGSVTSWGNCIFYSSCATSRRQAEIKGTVLTLCRNGPRDPVIRRDDIHKIGLFGISSICKNRRPSALPVRHVRHPQIARTTL